MVAEQGSDAREHRKWTRFNYLDDVRWLLLEPSEILDVPVSETARQLVEVPESASEDRTQQWIVEHIVGIPVPQVVEELVEVCRDFEQDRLQQCFDEQTIETLDISLSEKIAEKPVIQMQGNMQQAVNVRVEHVVSQSQFTDKGVDIPVVEDRQNCMNQNVQVVAETVEIPQLLTMLEDDSNYREICADVAQQMSVGASSRVTSQDRAEVPRDKVDHGSVKLITCAFLPVNGWTRNSSRASRAVSLAECVSRTLKEACRAALLHFPTSDALVLV